MLLIMGMMKCNFEIMGRFSIISGMIFSVEEEEHEMPRSLLVAVEFRSTSSLLYSARSSCPIGMNGCFVSWDFENYCEISRPINGPMDFGGHYMNMANFEIVSAK